MIARASYEIGRVDPLGRFGSGCPTVRPSTIGRGRVVRLLAAPADLTGRNATAWGDRAVAVGLLFCLGQQAEREHRGSGMLFAPEYLADAVGIGAKTLHDICERLALMTQNMCCNGIIKRETLPLDHDVIEFHPGYGVYLDCHMGPPFGNMVRRLVQNLRAGITAVLSAAAPLTGSKFESLRSGLPFYHKNCDEVQCLYPPKPRKAGDNLNKLWLCSGYDPLVVLQ